ncbi:MAG TPA: hypothetical protein VNA65_11220 [Candidatus Dormibacteraeota bacterium]|nr:hypothetical protein [Candidatus Dormibacteraeota bacterium]
MSDLEQRERASPGVSLVVAGFQTGALIHPQVGPTKTTRQAGAPGGQARCSPSIWSEMVCATLWIVAFADRKPSFAQKRIHWPRAEQGFAPKRVYEAVIFGVSRKAGRSVRSVRTICVFDPKLERPDLLASPDCVKQLFELVAKLIRPRHAPCRADHSLFLGVEPVISAQLNVSFFSRRGRRRKPDRRGACACRA